ncbi:MAG: 2-hydroxyacid dehydrogenase [Cytophagaceae bacterium]|nr:2-hydroxyacid dehydrogenase [Cytophagaceae bacterium]
MKVTVFSSKEFEKKSLAKAFGDKHTLNFITKSLSADTADLANGSDAVCIFPNDDACGATLEALHILNIHFIANRAAGYDHIDLNKASELNFSVANVPGYSPYAIAEHAVAMMLSLNRKIVRADHKVKDYDFTLDDLIGFDMNGKTVGIVGLGKIGSIVAKILNGLGCNILAYDIEQNQDYVKKYNVLYTTLDNLFSESDIITLHAPLNQHTKYMINKDNINKMKKGVMIINTGRGGLINTIDAIEGLKSNHIGYLGLDVYEKEKGLFFYDHSKEIPTDDTFARLLAFKNVLITGHQAFLTETALKNIADTTAQNLDCWQEGKPSPNELVSKKITVQ